MQNIQNGIIHEKGLTLSEHEREWMRDMNKAEAERILKLFRTYPSHKFDYRAVVNLTGIAKDNAKRALSDLAQDNPDKKNYMDEWNQPPLIKLGDDHKVKRKTKSGRTIRVHTWTYNEDYEVEPDRMRQEPALEEDGQGMLFSDSKPKQPAYAEANR